MGVDLFFVLSGYLIGAQILKRARSPGEFSFKSFYLSRALRTWPAYLAVLTALGLFVGLRERPMMPPLWCLLTFTQNLFALNAAFSRVWSLCIEEQFYLLCPFVILGLLRVRRMWATCLFIVTVLILGAMFRSHAWAQYQVEMTDQNRWELYNALIHFPTWGRLDGLVFGVSIAALQLFRPAAWGRLLQLRYRMSFASLVTLGVAVVLFRETSWIASVFAYPILDLGFALLLIFALTEEHRLTFLKSRVLTQAAILSYSFYLVHLQVIHFVSRHWPQSSTLFSQIAQALTALVVSSTLAFALYQLIERPFLDLRARWIRSA